MQGKNPWDEHQLASIPTGPGRFDYVLGRCEEPHLFVIRRRPREKPGTEHRTTAVYYILDGNVYAAPSLHSVLLARLSRCGFGMRRAMERLIADTRHPSNTGELETHTAEGKPRPGERFEWLPIEDSAMEAAITAALEKS